MGSVVIDRVEWRRRDDNGGIIIWRQMASSVSLLLLLLHTHPDPSSWKISLLLQWLSFIQVYFHRSENISHQLTWAMSPFIMACVKRTSKQTAEMNMSHCSMFEFSIHDIGMGGMKQATYNELLGRETSLQSVGVIALCLAHNLQLISVLWATQQSWSFVVVGWGHDLLAASFQLIYPHYLPDIACPWILELNPVLSLFPFRSWRATTAFFLLLSSAQSGFYSSPLLSLAAQFRNWL